MITITNKLTITDGPSLVLYSPAGDYQDTDLILYADEQEPGTPIAQFQAQFVKYGPVVYQYNSPEELGEALYTVDPESTHDAVALYKEELARDKARAQGTLTPSDPVPVAEVPVSNEEEADTKFFREEAAKAEASSTPEITGEVLGETTTAPEEPLPEVLVPETPVDPGPTSSTTPEVVTEPLPVIEAAPIEAVDLSTTTPE